MRTRALVIAISLLWIGHAGADHGSLHATATGNVAATDNVFSAGGDNADRQVDMFFQVRPGVIGAYETPRTINSLSAELEVLEYLLHSDSPSLTGHVGWTGLLTPGPRSEIVLGANASTGRLNALTTRNSADQTGIGITPAGASEVRQGDASEYLSWQATKETRTSESAFVRWTATNDELAMPTTTDSFESGLSLAFDRSFSHDSFGLVVGGSFLRLERIAPAGAMLGSRLDRQLNPNASAVWLHDVSKLWSINLNAGVVYVNPVGTDPYNPGATDRRAAPFPVFGGVVAYNDVWGRATLTAQRAVAPNLFIAQNTVSESAVAQVAMPLTWLDPHSAMPKFMGVGTLGVERTQLVDPTNAGTKGTFELAHLDVGVGWTPHPGQTYGVRYELVLQHGDSTATLVTPSFFRNTVFFTFALRYPGDLGIQVPRRTQSMRADRKDLAPLGAEPVVPEDVEPDSGGGGGE